VVVPERPRSCSVVVDSRYRFEIRQKVSCRGTFAASAADSFTWAMLLLRYKSVGVSTPRGVRNQKNAVAPVHAVKATVDSSRSVMGRSWIACAMT